MGMSKAELEQMAKASQEAELAYQKHRQAGGHSYFYMMAKALDEQEKMAKSP